MKTDHSESPARANAIQRLLEIMDKLRDPQSGCAWDLKQTLQSLTSHTLEEVYEVVDAVESGDHHELRDELGDLLFQIVFYARIAAEQQQFDFHDVADAISRKLLRRHPHIFPSGSLDSFGSRDLPEAISAEQVEVNWELIKDVERAEKAARQSDAAAPASVLDDVPRAFPALDRARKLQKRAASTGFDWPDARSVLSKLDEEREELQQAIDSGEQSAISHELGDLLFTCVNLSRHLKVEPETALREANRRFEARFRHMEASALQSGRALSDQDSEALEALWNIAKSQGL